MSSFRTQMKVAKLIQIMSENEHKVEIQRQLLCEQQHFEPYTVFKRLDINRSGHLSIFEITSFLNQNQIQISTQQQQFLMNEFDTNLDGHISYMEFIRHVLPKQDQQLKEIAQSRRPYQLEREQVLVYEIEWGLSRLLQTIIKNRHQEMVQLEVIRECQDFNTRDIFDSIDLNGKNNINSQQMDKFLKKCDIILSDEEFDSFFIKVDQDQDGVINYKEFQQYVLQNDTYFIKESPRKHNISYSNNRQHDPYETTNQFQDQEISVNNIININNSIAQEDKLANNDYEYYQKQTRSRGMSPSKHRASPLKSEQFRPYNRSPIKTMRNNEELKLVQSLKEQIYIDREIEQARKELALKNDFNLLDGFRILDQDSKSYISQLEFKEVMEKTLGLYFTKDEIYLFYKRYDKDNDGLFRYSDFCRVVQTEHPDYQNILKNREPTYLNEQFDLNQVLSYESIKSFKKVFSLCMNGEVQAEQIRQRLQKRPQFNLIEAFDFLDKDENGVISAYEFKTVLEDYGLFLDHDDLQGLIKRYDKNLDGKISYSEFCNEMLPKSPKKI